MITTGCLKQVGQSPGDGGARQKESKESLKEIRQIGSKPRRHPRLIFDFEEVTSFQSGMPKALTGSVCGREQFFYFSGDHGHGYLIAPTLGHDDVCPAFGRFHEFQMHRLHGAQILT